LGLGLAEAETGGIARRHLPFSAPGEGDIHSLGWAAALAYGASSIPTPVNNGCVIMAKTAREKVCRIIRRSHRRTDFPRQNRLHRQLAQQSGDPGAKELNNDKYRTPYTPLTGKAVGGMEIMATRL